MKTLQGWSPTTRMFEKIAIAIVATELCSVHAVAMKT